MSIRTLNPARAARRNSVANRENRDPEDNRNSSTPPTDEGGPETGTPVDVPVPSPVSGNCSGLFQTSDEMFAADVQVPASLKLKPYRVAIGTTAVGAVVTVFILAKSKLIATKAVAREFIKVETVKRVDLQEMADLARHNLTMAQRKELIAKLSAEV